MEFIPGSMRALNRQEAMASALTVTRTGFRTTTTLRRGAGLCLLGLISWLAGCDAPQTRKASPPASSVAPYQAVIAIAPFTNESGVSITPSQLLQVGDGLTTAINQGQGWVAVPLNRTIQAMRQLGLAQIDELSDASDLIRHMGVDAIILGTVTDWRPYDPPRFGANMILVSDEATSRMSFDSRRLEGSTGDSVEISQQPSHPIAEVVGIYDAADHGNALRLRDYAAGRYDLNGGFDPPERYYLMVYRRYVEYATWCLIQDLISNERSRMAGASRQANAQK